MVNNLPRITYGAESIKGTREYQQDAYRVIQAEDGRWTIAILCDGMGGLEGGETASNMVCDFILGQMMELMDEEDCTSHFKDIALRANELVLGLQNTDGSTMNAGTTMSMVLIRNGYMDLFSVGDSKIYYFNRENGTLICDTNEHSYGHMAEQMKENEDFVFQPEIRQDALVSYFGAPQLFFVDISEEPRKLHEGDRILLCSDGLYKLLQEEEIAQIIAEGEQPEEIATELIRSSLQKMKKSQDNTTVIVLDYHIN